MADENEFLRDTAYTAGQQIIKNFASTAIEVLLPQLSTGIFADRWRIRHSSVRLLGDLLFHLSGVTGKMSATGGEDENFGTNEGFKVDCFFLFLFDKVLNLRCINLCVFDYCGLVV